MGEDSEIRGDTGGRRQWRQCSSAGAGGMEWFCLIGRSWLCCTLHTGSVTRGLGQQEVAMLFHRLLSLRSHSLASSGTAPDRKWAGRGASRRGGGASWLNNLLEVEIALTKDSVLVVLEEGPVSHTASEASAGCCRRCRCCVVMGENCELCNMRMWPFSSLLLDAPLKHASVRKMLPSFPLLCE